MRVSRASNSFLRALVLLLVVTALSSCSLFHRGNKADESSTLPVEQLYQRGVVLLEGGNNSGAARCSHA